MNLHTRSRLSILLTTALLACGPTPMVVDGGAPPDAGAGTDAGVDAGVMPMPRCTTPATVRCEDQSIQRLNFRTLVSTGTITEEGATPGATTYLDARAGGMTTPESYLYVRFTPQGLEKVNIHDEAALRSMDWDLAFRRFIVRINSGVGGPSCVLAARTAPGTTFDGLTQVPAGLSWRTEEYFTTAAGADGGIQCEFVADPSGIGGPNAALTSYWSYQSCVQMTGNVFVLHLKDGRYVKLQVLSYYDPAPQMTCNQTGMVPQPSGAANFRIKWAFIPGP